MKRATAGFSIVELAIVITIILIIVTFSIPILSKTLLALRTRAAAEALGQQLYLARQAAINFGRRSSGVPLKLFIYPGTSTRGTGVWFDRNNRDTTSDKDNPPSNELITLPQGIVVGNDIGAGGSAQCTGSPIEVVAFNSRGELPVGYAALTCLATDPTGNNNPVSVYVESIKGTQATTRYLVGISRLGSVSIYSR